MDMIIIDVAAAHGPLTLKAGEKYTFEMTGLGQTFARNPFALTLSPTQANEIITSSITGTNPGVSDDDTLVYTPPSQGPATIYYQSTTTPNMGGMINIANSCNPSHTVRHHQQRCYMSLQSCYLSCYVLIYMIMWLSIEYLCVSRLHHRYPTSILDGSR
jgi:hypothetical protein